MVRIKIARSLEAAKEIVERFNGPLATVECEYGQTVVQGSVTLAHHVEGWTTAPSLQSNTILVDAGIEVVEGDYIMISHVDLDTVTGIMALLGRYDFDEDIKEGINFVDCNGQHHLFSDKISEGARRVILAYLGYAAANRAPQNDEDVTDYILTLIELFNTEEFYQAGLQIVTQRKTEAEASVVATVGPVAILEQKEDSKVFGLNSEYILNDIEYDYVIVFSNKFKSVTISARRGGKDPKNMAELMRVVFGPEAGGHHGIAGTPRGGVYSLADAAKLQEVLVASL